MALTYFLFERRAAVAKYEGSEETVVIDEMYKGKPVTEIMENAFSGNTSVQRIILPPKLEVIGDRAFVDCTALSFVNCANEGMPHLHSAFPDTLQIIGKEAFRNTKIIGVYSPAESLEIGDQAFCGCKQLVSFYAKYCTELTLGKRAFFESGLNSFSAPLAQNTMIPEECFRGCSKMTQLTIPFGSARFENITYIMPERIHRDPIQRKNENVKVIRRRKRKPQ